MKITLFATKKKESKRYRERDRKFGKGEKRMVEPSERNKLFIQVLSYNF